MSQLALDYTRTPPMEPHESAVWAVIQNRKGREAAVSVRDLQTITGLSGVAVRSAVHDLIDRHGKLIGSASGSPAGFWMIETQEELEAATGHLRSRAMEMLVRCAKLKRRSVEDVFGQALIERMEA